MNDTSFPKFRSFYDLLVRTGTFRGISFADSEDLAGDAIERALSAFVPAKGEFSVFCRAIHSNLMKNYWRDRKKTEPFEDVEGPADPGGEIDPLELAESLREIRSVLSEIEKKLSDDENAFLKHLQAVLDESGSRAISEAARCSGLTPAKGWDLFRKIQRKARGVSPGKMELRTVLYSRSTESPSVPTVEQLRPIFGLPARDITGRFTPEQLNRIESLLS